MDARTQAVTMTNGITILGRDAGTMRAADIHAELGELIGGRKPGRTTPDEITIFDGCGLGIQDVAASARAYELARERRAGARIAL